jgi:cytochrome c oxidase cbb3-type subunit III
MRNAGAVRRRLSVASTTLLRAAFVSSLPTAFALTAAQPPEHSAAVMRGRSAFAANCAFCHGSQATGSEQAPSLVRSPLVRQDVNGNLLIPMIKAGRPTLGMPSFSSLPAEQISDIAVFLHRRATEERGHGHAVPETALLVGNAKEGESYFKSAGGCSGCHSTAGDLAHIGSKYSPLNLTVAFLTPAAQPNRVEVTLPSGDRINGTLDYLDEFAVSMTDTSGQYRTWFRDRARSVRVIDPLAAHRELLPKYTDADIHNLLAYLVTLK